MDKAMHSEFEGHTPVGVTIQCRKDNRTVGYWHHDEWKVRKHTIKLYQEDEQIDKCLEDIKEYTVKRGEPGHEFYIKTVFVGQAAPDLLKENQSLRSELQKQKELNAELQKRVDELEDKLNDGLSPGHIQDLIKKSKES